LPKRPFASTPEVIGLGSVTVIPGVRLFERGSQGVELTTYGAALLNCGVAVFDEMRQGLKQLEALSDPASGEVRIGCSEITMAGLLPAIVERFSQQYPRVRIHVIWRRPRCCNSRSCANAVSTC
jgi:DNA-binding transcriptional LysR family regulator